MCTSPKICSGNKTTDQNGKQQNLDPNGSQDIQKQAQQIQTGELGPNAQTGQLPPHTQATGENPNAPTQSTGANTQTGQLGPNTQTGQLGPNAQTGQLGPNAQTGELGPNTGGANTDPNAQWDAFSGGQAGEDMIKNNIQSGNVMEPQQVRLNPNTGDIEYVGSSDQISGMQQAMNEVNAWSTALFTAWSIGDIGFGSSFGGGYGTPSGGGGGYSTFGGGGGGGNTTGFSSGGTGGLGNITGAPGSAVYQAPGAGTGPGLMQSAQELAQQQALQESQAQNQAQNQSAVQSYLNSCGGFSSCVAQGLNSAADYTTAAVKNLYDGAMSAIYGPQPVQVASNDGNAPIMNDAGSMLLGDTPAPNFNSPAAQQAIQSGVRSYTTAYAPGAGGSMEGGFTTSRPNLSGQYVPATLDDVRLGNSNYVTLAGAPENYGKFYDMGSVTYKSPIDGVTYTGDPSLADPSNPKGPVYDPHLADVTGYVNDTGSAFSAGTCGNYGTCGIRQNKFDVAVGNFSGWNDARASNFVASEPFTGTNSWDQVAGLPSSNVADSGIPNGGSLTGTGSSLPSDVVAQAEGNLATQYGPTTGLGDLTQFSNTPSVSELTNLPPSSFQAALQSAPNPTIPVGNVITSSLPVTFEVQGSGVTDLGANAYAGDLGPNASAADIGGVQVGPPSGLLQVQPVSPSSPIALNNIGAAALESIPAASPVSPLLNGVASGALGTNASPFDIGGTSPVSPYIDSGSPLGSVALDQPGYQLPEVAVNESGDVTRIGGTLNQANPNLDFGSGGYAGAPNGAGVPGSSQLLAGLSQDASQALGAGQPSVANTAPAQSQLLSGLSQEAQNALNSQSAPPAGPANGTPRVAANVPPAGPSAPVPRAASGPSGPSTSGGIPSPSAPSGGSGGSGSGSGLGSLMQSLGGLLQSAMKGGSGSGSSGSTRPIVAATTSILSTPVAATQFPPAPPLTAAPQVVVTASPNPVAPDAASTVSWNSSWQPGNATSTRECAMIDANGTVLSGHASTTGTLPTPALSRAAYFIVGCKEQGGTLGSAVVLVSVRGSTEAPVPLPQPLGSYQSVSGASSAGSDLESALGGTAPSTQEQQQAQNVACDPNSSSYFDCLTGKMQFVDKLY